MFRFALIFLLPGLAYSLSLSNIIKKLPQSTVVSASVYDFKKHKLIFKHNDKLLMTPASAVKLFTAYSALKHLGADFRYITKIGITGSHKLGVLNGDVWLEFSGDPSFKMQQMQQMFNWLKKQGVSEVNGDINLYGSRMPSNNYGPGWMWDEVTYCYASPISSFIVNENCFYVHAKLDKSMKYRVSSSNNVKIKSTVVYNKKCKPNIHIQFLKNNEYLLNGCLNQKSWSNEYAINPTQELFKSNIQSALRFSSIKLRGDVKYTNKKPNKYKLENIIKSPKLTKILLPVLQDSNNIFSSSLFLSQIGKYWGKNIWKVASAFSESFYKDHNISDVRLVDGSGLSRYNRLTANSLLKLLKKVLHEKEIMNALAEVGKSGTLQYSKALLQKNTKIKGKTGSMDGVNVVAGYVFLNDKPRFAFVLMQEGMPDHHKLRLDVRKAFFTRLSKLALD